jgi:hypothetical protein
MNESTQGGKAAVIPARLSMGFGVHFNLSGLLLNKSYSPQTSPTQKGFKDHLTSATDGLITFLVLGIQDVIQRAC